METADLLGLALLPPENPAEPPATEDRKTTSLADEVRRLKQSARLVVDAPRRVMERADVALRTGGATSEQAPIVFVDLPARSVSSTPFVFVDLPARSVSSARGN